MFRSAVRAWTPLRLAHYAGIAPLWTTLTFGTAQANEGLYMNLGTAGKVVFRWAAETQTGSPVNFSVTLNDDGAIDFSYGSGNGNLALVPTAAGCGSGPTTGISNGHDLYSQIVRLVSTANFALRWEPPFNYSSVPQVTLEAPVANATVQGVAHRERRGLRFRFDGQPGGYYHRRYRARRGRCYPFTARLLRSAKC